MQPCNPVAATLGLLRTWTEKQWKSMLAYEGHLYESGAADA